jgi:uncharacterized protein YceK
LHLCYICLLIPKFFEIFLHRQYHLWKNTLLPSIPTTLSFISFSCLTCTIYVWLLVWCWIIVFREDTFALCYKLNMSPWNLYWSVIPTVIFEGRVFERSLSHEGRALTSGISALIKHTQGTPSPHPSCEDIVRKWLSMSQEAGPHQTLNLPGSWF